MQICNSIDCRNEAMDRNASGSNEDSNVFKKKKKFSVNFQSNELYPIQLRVDDH